MVAPTNEAGLHVDKPELRIMRKSFAPSGDSVDLPSITLLDEDVNITTNFHDAVQQKKNQTMLNITTNSGEFVKDKSCDVFLKIFAAIVKLFGVWVTAGAPALLRFEHGCYMNYVISRVKLSKLCC